MSDFIANVNGKDVFSDKKMRTIEGTKITFTDGSWCDVATGQIANSGPGYVNIGAPEGSADEKIDTRTTRYPAHHLDVRDVAANVQVEVHSLDSVEVTVSGPAGEIEKIQIRQQADTVVIAGEGEDSSSRNGITISGGGSVTTFGGVRGSAIVIGGGRSGTIITGNVRGSIVISDGGACRIKIVVKVPKGASVYLSGVIGDSTVGDTDGALHVATTSGDVRAGRVAMATIGVQGSGDVDIQEVNGPLNINVMGSGNVVVPQGTVTTLSIQIMGSGDVSFRGVADSATLNVMGSGDIFVARVKGHVAKKVMGSGDIHVGR